ncbi:DUF4083 domain-containing protein [Gracilibacillus oryzae]|uniref:DUF4083 domain-containing protein n=1 Tax=Gracilibacillus oryzae TaxID=1672701 RepID=A0A7C8GV80_9BACI|nr:DUF4083 family protein [Gracilibacillus oryzae]KAB8138155.1 DUF4083 domain-containing protein [Gracilibacillus oryzae]
MEIGSANVVIPIFFFALIILSAVFFTLLIRWLLISSSASRNQSAQMEAKLDRIIELLEEDKNR